MAKSKKGASGNPRSQPQESVPNAAKVVGPAISSAKPESAEMKKVGAVAEEEEGRLPRISACIMALTLLLLLLLLLMWLSCPISRRTPKPTALGLTTQHMRCRAA